MSKYYWQILYVDNGFNKQIEPIHCRQYDVADIDTAMQDMFVLEDVNTNINGFETWFRLALMNECEEVVMYRDFKKGN